jgi:hypothetical protein
MARVTANSQGSSNERAKRSGHLRVSAGDYDRSGGERMRGEMRGSKQLEGHQERREEEEMEEAE